MQHGDVKYRAIEKEDEKKTQESVDLLNMTKGVD